MKRPLHVTIVVADLPAERDRRVIRECLTLEANGYEVTVVAPRGHKDLRTLPGSRSTRLRPYTVRVLGSGPLTYAVEFGWSFTCVAVRLLGELLRGRAQAVQACNPPDVYWPLALLFRMLRRPWVFDHHDLCPEIYATRTDGRPRRSILRILRAMERLTLRTASAVITTNESFRENALRQGVPEHRVCVVRNGPALDEIAAVPAREAAPTDGMYRIVYLGVLGPQDNVRGAILAAQELTRLRGRTDWRLAIAGDGECLPELKALVAELGLDDLVSFPGWLHGPEVDEFLRDATVAIQPDLPTRMNDLSTMAKTVEYLGRGIPVVAADLTETRRTAAEAAVYVPHGTPEEYAEALHRLLDDAQARAAMRACGRTRFEQVLAWDHQAKTYADVWNALFARHGDGVARPRIPAQRGADRTAPEETTGRANQN